jgi:hypothetical protein
LLYVAFPMFCNREASYPLMLCVLTFLICSFNFCFDMRSPVAMQFA